MSGAEIGWALAGGVLIGAASGALMLTLGRIAGISGIFSGLLDPQPGEFGWRSWFVAGLVAGGLVLLALRPEAIPEEAARPLALTVIGGLFVGFGARLGSGCTSGHGVCGIGRVSPRSLIATGTFITTGAIAVLLARVLTGA